MINRIVVWSAHHPIKVLLLASLAAVGSYVAQRSLARDVLPDLSEPQLVLVAEWMGHPALEVAHEVTEVMTRELQTVPNASAIRGQSMTGMAYVDIGFSSASAITRGREEIRTRIEKLRTKLPPTVRLQLGPEASSTGWVFQYALIPPPQKKGMPMGARRPELGPNSLYGLRKFQDEILKPQLAAIPGIAEVATLGGETKELLIQTSADQLRGAGLALSDVMRTVSDALRSPKPTLTQLASAPIAQRADGSSVSLGTVAKVEVAPAMASGMADVDGNQPIVAGIVVAKRGADIARVLRNVRAVIDQQRKRLPSDVRLGVLYDRSEFGERVEKTLHRTLLEEVSVVTLVVLVFLLHLRSALIPVLTLPLIVLVTFAAMRILGVPATIMSLGGIAIALGMAVDADLVALEACHRRIEARHREASSGNRRRALIEAAESFAPAILTSLVIAALAFVPVFAFGGETGRLLRPLAITKTLVIAAAALVTLTVAPALRDRLLGARVVPEFSNPITRTLVRLYRPFVHFALTRPAFTLITAALAALSCLPIVTRLGGEFLPRIDEGTLLYMPTTAPGVSADDAGNALAKQDEAIASQPGVDLVFGKTGRAETATDPAPFSMNETTIRLTSREQWPKIARHRWYSGWAPSSMKRVLGKFWPEETPATVGELTESLDRKVRFAGWTNAWTAPIRARLDMMSTGVRTPVGVRIITGDPSRLDSLAAKVRSQVMNVPETKSATYESLGGETRVTFEVDPEALARHRVRPELVRSAADLLINGGEMGSIELPQEPLEAQKSTANSSAAGRPHGSHHDHAAQGRAESKAAPAPAASQFDTPVNDQSVTASAYLRSKVRITFAAPWQPKPLDQLLREVTVRGGDGEGQPVPLGLLGHPRFISVPALLHTERGGPVGYVYVDIEDGTDVANYVKQARAHFASANLGLLPGERLEWTGQYELLMAAQARLKWIAPAVAVSMFLLLLWQFRSIAEALIVLVSVPFALVGSFWSLYWLDYKFSAPVWVGLLSVVGLAMQTGVVMVVYIDDAYRRRMRAGQIRNRDDIVEAHAEGTVMRLRPKIMTITTMAAALLPLMWAQGSGSEIMKRVAAPMLGGLVTSAFLTLEVIPVLYTLWRTWELHRVGNGVQEDPASEAGELAAHSGIGLPAATPVRSNQRAATR